MSKNEMFVTATRNKFRFPFRGQISVEDLWDLSVENLDSVYKTLNSQVKKAKEESLLNTKSREDEIIEMQIEIVKYIVSVKQDEAAKKVAAKEKKARKQRILEVLAAKEDADLQNKSPEELQAMLSELDDDDE
jgi:hypothetical protein